MDTVNLSNTCGYGPCTGSGPWVQADLENGVYQGNRNNPANTTVSSDFVTAMLKNQGGATAAANNFELEGGNAQSGGLTTMYNGPLPPPSSSGQSYVPMSKEGAIVLGTGGDNSNNGVGSFFEGVVTQGFPSDAADAAVQAGIVSAGFAGNTNPGSGSGSGSGSSGTPSAAGPAVVHSAGATGAGANGFSSVYTVDASNDDLQETYLPAITDPWTTQSLSANYGTPATGQTPIVLLHPDASGNLDWTSVYTINEGSSDLQETYLPNTGFPGDPWITQNLSANYGTPPVA